MPADPGEAAFHDPSQADDLERALPTFHRLELNSQEIQYLFPTRAFIKDENLLDDGANHLYCGES